MELLKAYSNFGDQAEQLRALLDLPQSRPSDEPIRGPRQEQIRLDPDRATHLVMAYQDGCGVKKLAAEFGIHRQTVRIILQREGVYRFPGIQPEDLQEAIQLYEAGWSFARLAARYGVAPSTVNNTLRRAGVKVRPQGRPSN